MSQYFSDNGFDIAAKNPLPATVVQVYIVNNCLSDGNSRRGASKQEKLFSSVGYIWIPLSAALESESANKVRQPTNKGLPFQKE